MSPIIGIMASSISGNIVPAAFESIQTILVTSNTASITFTSIPSTYKHLQVRMVARSNQFSVPGLRIRFNSDAASNYSFHSLAGNGSTTFSGANANATSISIVGVGAGDQGANQVGSNVIDILDYASTTKYKTMRAIGGNMFKGATANNIGLYGAHWRNSGTAINSIYMETDTLFVANSYFALYGIKG